MRHIPNRMDISDPSEDVVPQKANDEENNVNSHHTVSGIDRPTGFLSAYKGKPKSGRIWKRENHKKSEMIQVKAVHVPWNRRQKKRADFKALKEYERSLKEEATRVKEEKRKLQQEREKRKEENRKNAEIVQKITNTAKIKRMKKKQLKMIEKR